MKVCSKCKTEKGLAEYGTDKRGIKGVESQCKSCKKLHYEANKSRILIKNKEYYKDNIDKIKIRDANNYKANSDRCKKNTSEYYKKNKKEIAKKKAKYYLDNVDSFKASSAKRRATKLNQTPNLTKKEEKQIVNIYKESRELTKSSGIQRYVHHIVPLEDGGLHHPDNLEILTKEEHNEAHRIIRKYKYEQG